MSFTLYEVWAEDEDGLEELIDTTASKTEAFKIAEQVVMDGAAASVVYQETEDGDSIEVQRFEGEE